MCKVIILFDKKQSLDVFFYFFSILQYLSVKLHLNFSIFA